MAYIYISCIWNLLHSDQKQSTPPARRSTENLSISGVHMRGSIISPGNTTTQMTQPGCSYNLVLPLPPASQTHLYQYVLYKAQTDLDSSVRLLRGFRHTQRFNFHSQRLSLSDQHSQGSTVSGEKPSHLQHWADFVMHESHAISESVYRANLEPNTEG